MIFYRRMIVLICTISILLVNCLPIRAAEITDENLVDESQNQVIKDNKHLTILKNLGLLEGTDLIDKDADTTLTRAQYAAVVCNIFKLSEKDSPKDLPFNDVPDDHKNYGAIATTNALGSMKGISDTLFKPDGSLVYQDAVKVLVSMLGYESVAQQQGGYPVGYMMTAKNIGLIDNSTKITGDITVGDLAYLFYNLLETQPLKFTKVKDGVAYYEVRDDENFMSEYWDLYKTTGVLNGIYFSGFNNAPSVKQGEIAIDGIVYESKVDGSDAYFAHKVEVYYQQDDNDSVRTALHIEDVKKLQSLTIADKDTNYQNNKYTYYVDDRDYDAYISEDAEIFYNGKHTKYYEELMVPDNGDITLIDYNQDESYDVVLIKNLATAVVSLVDQENYCVMLKNYITVYSENGGLTQDNTNIVKMDPEECNGHIYDNTLAEKAFEELNKGMIVSVALSLDKTIANIYYGEDRVTGTISYRDDEKIGIGDKEYSILYGLINEQSVSPGKTGDFYMDFRGKIVWAVTASNIDTMGVVLRTSMPQSKLDYPEVLFLNTVDKEKIVYKINEKLFIDDISYSVKTQSELANLTRLLRRSMIVDGKEYLSYKLIYIKTDAEGFIKQIHTVDSAKYENFNVVNTGAAGYEKAEVAIRAQTIGDRGIFNDVTSFIYMPYVAAENADYLTNAENYIFFRNKWMIGDLIGKFVDFYYTNDDNIIDVLVRYGIQLRESMLPDAANPEFILPPAIMENVGIVKSISSGIDANGNEISLITFIRSDGTEKTEVTNTRYSSYSNGSGSIGYEQLETGDVFSYLTASGIIGNFCKMFDCSKATLQDSLIGVPLGYVDLLNMYPNNVIPADKNTATAGVYKSSYRAVVGTVYDTQADSFKIALGDSKDDSNLAIFGYKAEQIIVCDTKRYNRLYKGTLADLKGLKYYKDSASRIVAYSKDGSIIAFFVYN